MKFDVNLISNAVAAALSGYGGYMAYTNWDGSDSDKIKYVLALVIGVGYLVWNNLGSVKTMFSGTSKPKSARVFFPEDFEEQDFKCLVHLRNRVVEAGSVDGVATCEKLSQIVFGLHSKEKLAQLREKTDEVVK